MEDELITKIRKLIKFYHERYRRDGNKQDRLRARILISYLDDLENRLGV